MTIATSSLCVPILHMSYDPFVYKVESKLGNTLIVVHLCDTFLYYLFAYDDARAFEWSMLWEDKSANRANSGVLDLCSWISFPFDPGNELKGGTCLVMLAYKNTLDDPNVHGTFLYYLFAYDESHTCVGCAFFVGWVFIEVHACLYNPIIWTFYHFDPGERLGLSLLGLMLLC